MDSWFHAAVHSSDGNQKMVAEDPLRKLCLGRLKNVPAQVVCIALVALQAVLLNHHLQVTSDDVRLWSWFVGDAAVVASFVFTFYFREWRVKHVANKHQEPTGFSKGLPFGSISWLIYAILLGARVAVVFKKDLHSGHDIVDLKLTISLVFDPIK
ncbi:hypothetical protein EB796_007551 [Bugula neritina]|uniref:Uncharacterized protein n=1 Tax=Bugula neritina TaxID=10212 RepID=A0A7J7K6A4_BUGNE|nr:hypothetical protein EB796_007551 [Bugula neritina]